jgi:hypothetical protein
MTDYNKLKVADLRALLKERNIPSTGLTRKAQIIEKLEEHDHQDGGAATGHQESEPAAEAEQEQAEEQTVVEPTDEAASESKSHLHFMVNSPRADH